MGKMASDIDHLESFLSPEQMEILEPMRESAVK